jgi:hypothetical protein
MQGAAIVFIGLVIVFFVIILLARNEANKLNRNTKKKR